MDHLLDALMGAKRNGIEWIALAKSITIKLLNCQSGSENKSGDNSMFGDTTYLERDVINTMHISFANITVVESPPIFCAVNKV